MDSLQFIANHIITIYIMIAIGVIAGKTKLINEHISICLSKILLNICLPLYIISAFRYPLLDEVIEGIIIVFVFGIIIHPLCYLFGKLIYKNKEDLKKKVYIFSLMFSNCGYIGFPIIESIYGNVGIIYGSIFLAPYNIFLWTIGVSLFKKTSSRFSFLNIGVIAVIVGILIYLFQIELPYFIDKSITSFGLMTIPLSMLIIGGILSKIKLRDLFKSKSIYLLSLLRLLLIPLVVLGFLYLLEIDKTIISVSVLVIAMPVAITLPVLTQRYNGDTDFATKTVIISTFLSILTIPIIVIILNKIY